MTAPIRTKKISVTRRLPAGPAKLSGGFVLLIVMVSIASCALVAVSLMFRTSAESNSVSSINGHQQAYAAALSGVRRAVSMRVQNPDNVEMWRDNPDVFYDQPVWFDGVVQWSYTVYCPDSSTRDGFRFGAADEAERININGADESTLAAMGLLDAVQIDCLLDYIDADSDVRTQGAENEQYEDLDLGYGPLNAPMFTVEQALMVPGISAVSVYGEDANRNGLLDTNEDDGDEIFPPDNSDGQLDKGLAAIATTFSSDYYKTSRRYNVNDFDSIMPSPLSPNTLALIQARQADKDWLLHPIELLDATYQSPSNPNVNYVSDVTANNIDTVHDLLTQYYAGNGRTANDPTSVHVGVKSSARVNIMTASEEVLQYVGNMGPNIAASIVAARGSVSKNDSRSCAWILQQGLVDVDMFKELAPHLTTRSDRMHVRSVGYATPGGRFCVLEAVVDVSGDEAKLVYLRDLTRYGMPLAIEPQ